MSLFHNIRRFEVLKEKLLFEYLLKHERDKKLFPYYDVYDIPTNSKIHRKIDKEFLKTIVRPILVSILNNEFKDIKKRTRVNEVVVECGDGVKFYIERVDYRNRSMDFVVSLCIDDSNYVYKYRFNNVVKRSISKFPNCLKDTKEEIRNEVMRDVIRILVDSKLSETTLKKSLDNHSIEC